MSRKPGNYKPIRVPFTLIEPAIKHLELLVKSGYYGNSKTEAVKLIVLRHLQSLEKQGKLPRIAYGDVPQNGDKE